MILNFFVQCREIEIVFVDVECAEHTLLIIPDRHNTETLFTVERALDGAFESVASSGDSDRVGTVADGQYAVTAPTDGIYYARPTPDAPPFVTSGAVIRTGQPVGLVEVMKTFNQILYGGDGLPDEAEIVEIHCVDGDEIDAGKLLMTVKST